MKITHDTQLTSSEISFLWGIYLGDTLSICVNKYFLQHIQDKNIKTIVEHTLNLSQQHVEIVRGIFTDEEIPIPLGFTEEDVNLKAKRLYSDTFCLNYVKGITKVGLATYSVALSSIFREDILSFNSQCIASLVELNNETTRVLLEKGLATRPPSIPYPTKVEFVHKQSFILEMLGKRPLLGIEVANLYTNILTNNLGFCMGVGFAQVADSKELRDYFSRGIDIALKHVKVFGDYLENQSITIPLPLSSNQDVTDSTESPFSDKLMMYHLGFISAGGAGNYGVSISTSMRSDLTVDYSRLIAEVLKYSEDGLNIMIKNGWFEQPPLASHRVKG
nr:DUF3231 family protein [Paenisporosarcina sp. TG-14]